MKIKLSDIKSGFQNRFFDIPVVDIPQKGTVFKNDNIRCRLSVDLLDINSFNLNGEIDTKIEYKCVRCLDLFDSIMYLPFDILLTNKLESSIDKDMTEIIDLSSIKDELDFSNILAEFIELDKPMKPLCQDRCNGICPICGINKNNLSCDCKNDQTNGIWDKLKKLENKKTQGE